MGDGWQGLGSVAGIAAAVRSGRLDPLEPATRALRVIEETAHLNAVVHVDTDGALAVAANHDRTGSLAGVPVLVKEIIEVAGLRTVAGPGPSRAGSAPATRRSSGGCARPVR